MSLEAVHSWAESWNFAWQASLATGSHTQELVSACEHGTQLGKKNLGNKPNYLKIKESLETPLSSRFFKFHGPLFFDRSKITKNCGGFYEELLIILRIP